MNETAKQAMKIETTGTMPDGLSYVPDFLSRAEHDHLLSQLRGLEFKHDKFRGQELKRSYAQFGYSYVTTGRKLSPAPPWPDFLRALSEKGSVHCPEGTIFSQCIVTRYPHGAGITWHPDAPVFGDCIMAISLASAALLQLRPNNSEKPTCEVLTIPGSLYVMRGPARWDYQHQVPQVKAERYSITMRWVDESSEIVRKALAHTTRVKKKGN